MRSVIAGFLLAGACFGSTQQILAGYQYGAPIVNSANSYGALVGNNITTPNPIGGSYLLTSSAGTFSNFCAKAVTTPGGGAKEWQVNFYEAGSVPAGAPTITLTNTNVTCDSTDAIHVAAGVLICVQIVPVSSPTTSTASWLVTWTPDIFGETMMMTSNAGVGAADFISVAGANTINGAENNIQMPASCAGIAKKLYIQVATASASGTWNVALNDGGSATTLTATIPTSTTTVVTDLVDTPSISAADLIDFHITIASGTVTSSDFYISAVFSPTVPGNFMFGGVRVNSGISNSAPSYISLTARPGGAVTTQGTPPYQLIGGMTVTAIYAFITTNPGSGKSLGFTLTVLGTGSTAVTTTITNATASSATGFNVVVPANSLVDTTITPTSTPTVTGILSVSYLGYIAPSGTQPNVMTQTF